MGPRTTGVTPQKMLVQLTLSVCAGAGTIVCRYDCVQVVLNVFESIVYIVCDDIG